MYPTAVAIAILARSTNRLKRFKELLEDYLLVKVERF
jgi:hypothetical protein